MKENRIFAIFRLIMACSLLLMIAACAQANLDIKKTRIQEGLNSCIGKLTKKDLAMKASTPTEHLSVNDGEIWVYKYRGTRGMSKDGYPTSMDVRVNFDNNGIMRDYVATGHLGEFETPFETIRCENLPPAVPSAGNASVPAIPAGGYLGVKVQSMTADMAQASGLNKVKGAFVLLVSKNSPAEEAGLKSGDIILAFEGKEINESSALPAIVAATPIGRTVEVMIYRDGRERAVSVKVGNLPSVVPNTANAPVPGVLAGAYEGSRAYGNGDKYVGDFVRGTFNGKGIYTYANGDKYEGEFVNGKITGKGTFTCVNGAQFKGNLEGKEPLGLKITCD